MTDKPSSATKESTTTFKHTEQWADIFLSEFTKESDRAAVIVTAAIFDNALLSLLKQRLVPNASGEDELFDGANAPCSTFSAKIAFAHRMGLISTPFARNLHLIRKIRNEFAHNIHGGSFDDTAVKSRVMELYRSQSFRSDNAGKLAASGPRGDFLLVCSWMLWFIHSQVELSTPIKSAVPEFGFKTDSSSNTPAVKTS